MPKQKQLSVSLIALMSVLVISLVVWLLLLFLSVTEGMEKNWLGRLTALNAPIRIVPTDTYYRSYYYKIDTIAQGANYTPKTIQEKLLSAVSDPYDPHLDEAIPSYWPFPVRDDEGALVDPVKRAFTVFEELGLAARDYEISGAMLKLQLGEDRQNFLTQVSYVSTFPKEVDTVQKLFLPPTVADINYLLHRNPSDFRSILTHAEVRSISTPQGSLRVKVDPSSLATASDLSEVLLLIAGGGAISWQNVVIEEADVHFRFTVPPLEAPPWMHIVEGKVVLPDRKSVILPKNFRDSGVHLGDTGSLSYGAFAATSFQEQSIPVYVIGFYDPGLMMVGARPLFAEGEIVQAINAGSSSIPLDPLLCNGIQVWFDDLSKTKEIAAMLQGHFDKAEIAPYWEIKTFYDYDFAKDLLGQFRSDRYLFTLIGLIILVVACTNIISLLLLLVQAKKKEIAILQVLGAKKRHIALIFGLAGALLGVVSSLIGTLLGVLTLHYLDSVVRFLSFLQGQEAFNAVFYGSSLPNEISHNALLLILITTPILSLLAGLIPAMKACQFPPAHILRSE